MLQELVQPYGILLDSNIVYAVEKDSIMAYQLPSGKRLFSFGKTGEGPGEFLSSNNPNPLSVSVFDSQLVVNSQGKLSFWTKTGEYTKEKNFSVLDAEHVLPIDGQRYLADNSKSYGGTWYQRIILLDSEMKEKKELFRTKHRWQGQETGIALFLKHFIYCVGDRYIYLPGEEDNEISVYTKDLILQRTITIPKLNHRIGTRSKNLILEEVKPIRERHPSFPWPVFPEYFPTIATFFVDNDLLYVFPHPLVQGEDSYLCYVFDSNDGKLLHEKKVIIHFYTHRNMFPVTIKSGMMYQLIESDDEEWRLVRQKIH